MLSIQIIVEAETAITNLGSRKPNRVFSCTETSNLMSFSIIFDQFFKTTFSLLFYAFKQNDVLKHTVVF